MSSEPTAQVKPPGLLEEIQEYWRKWPHKPLFFALLTGWLALFYFVGNSTLGYINTRSIFGWLNYCYNNSQDDEHGKLIPFVVIVLFWWKRQECFRAAKDGWWPALGLLLFGLALHVVGYAIQQTRISVVGFFIGLYGLTGLVWGREWLWKSFFPMILFAFCVPARAMAEIVTLPMRMKVTWLSVGFTHNILGIDVFQKGSQIIDGHGMALYDVAPACSGIRSLTTLLAITLVYGFVNFQKSWKRLLMVLLAFPVALLGNTARIVTVIIVGDAFGKDKGAMIEQKFGFITFAVAVSAILAVGWLLREDRTKKDPAPGLPLDAKTA